MLTGKDNLRIPWATADICGMQHLEMMLDNRKPGGRLSPRSTGMEVIDLQTPASRVGVITLADGCLDHE